MSSCMIKVCLGKHIFTEWANGLFSCEKCGVLLLTGGKTACADNAESMESSDNSVVSIK
jgi:hypothetical protein